MDILNDVHFLKQGGCALVRYLSIFMKELYQKKIIVILLMLLCAISAYSTDVLFTIPFSRQIYLNYLYSNVGPDHNHVFMLKNMEYFDQDYTPELGQKLLEFIREEEGVEACGRFYHAEMPVDDNLQKVLVVEHSIKNIGNIKIEDEESAFEQGDVFIYAGSSLKNKYNIGDSVSLDLGGEIVDACIAGFLKRDSSWPVKDQFSGGVSPADSFTLDEKLMIVTNRFQRFDNSGGMPDILYYITSQDSNEIRIKSDIQEWTKTHDFGVSIMSQNDAIQIAKEKNNITKENTFNGAIILFLLTIITISAASIVSCLMKLRNLGIFIACGIRKKTLIIMNYLECVLYVVIPDIIIWMFRQKQFLGTLSVAPPKELSMLAYCDFYSHSVMIPLLLLLQVGIISIVAGVIPSFLIRRMNVANIIRNIDIR